ncbi:Ubiquitin-like protein 4A [Geranomyces variabilis]|uniref:Ubiquitin-like protein 4A n=1 Tax=Geranomyces variabilis TaxID=109894 RepID=A0AAD5TPA3_9FUNG|nr:Ubiquitin-like protein 4A [Geranomyces variabilis]
MSLVLDPAEELAFATHFLTQVGVKSRRFKQTYEPSPSELSTPLPSASRPFVLRDAGPTNTSTTVTLTIKPLKSAAFSISATTALTPIGDLKARIARESGIPVVAQRLVFAGKGLVDSKTLQDYEIADGATLHLMRKPGMKEEPAAVAEKKPETRAERLKRVGGGSAIWKELRTVLKAHAGEDADAVFNEFVKSYHGLCGPLTAAQREALQKAETQSS